MQKLLHSIDESVEITGLKRTKLYELLLSGQLRSVKVGRRRLIPTEALTEFVDNLITGQDAHVDSAKGSFTWPEQPDDR